VSPTNHEPRTTNNREAVSFVVPMRNGESMIRVTLDSIAAQTDGRPLEIIVVDDGSADRSIEEVEAIARRPDWTIPLRVIRRHGNGAAAAVNAGVRAARYPLIAQVDQDLRLQPGWMATLAAALDDPSVAAAQGYYATDPAASMCARVMALDLEARYAAITGDTDHVCTGNTIYRAAALHAVGLFDEALGYGYDNDISYRLRDCSYRLVLCRDARSFHLWRDDVAGYLRQQYGFGYGRLDLVAKHTGRFAGDRVSPLPMMMHPLVMALALTAFALSIAAAPSGESGVLVGIGGALVALLAAERLVTGIGAARRFGNRAAWLFPVFHLLRDLAWVAAIVNWSARRLFSGGSLPFHSMRPRALPSSLLRYSEPVRGVATGAQVIRVVALIPAHNEAANLESVVGDVLRQHPDLAVLVVDDGSTDETPEVLERLGVRSVRFPERMGIGSAMRAGLRYARRLGFDAAVRLDGDGRHDAGDIDVLLAPIVAREADAVLGTRYAGTRSRRGGKRMLRVPLATCLTALTGRRVTDPTSGFCAFGPAAMRLLAHHHPDGYAEPELRLLLSRNGMRVLEMPVLDRVRRGGRTSLTAGRLLVAGARVLLAMLIVPLRPIVKEPPA
jgi:glycosyltransferase involved in cell wall biosynthesis